jgi:hypothetical protein
MRIPLARKTVRIRQSRKHASLESDDMLETRQTIMNNIHEHIKGRGGSYREWRIGVCTGQEKDRLEVPGAGESLLFQQAQSTEDATAIMAYFVYIYDVVRDKHELAFENCDIVYIYKASQQVK